MPAVQAYWASYCVSAGGEGCFVLKIAVDAFSSPTSGGVVQTSVDPATYRCASIDRSTVYRVDSSETCPVIEHNDPCSQACYDEWES